MTKTINTYEEYLEEMKVQISSLMEKLYQYKEEPGNKGSAIKECSELASLVIDLGSVSDKLRPYFNINIPPQHGLIDEWLKNINIEKLQLVFCVAMLRYTYAISKGLKNWIEFRDKVAIKLDNEGKDSKKILKGLL